MAIGDCKQNRKIRKAYLDNKRYKHVNSSEDVNSPSYNTCSIRVSTSQRIATPLFDITGGLNIGMVNSDAKQRRLLRKLYLENKRQKTLSNSQIQHVSPNNDDVTVSVNYNVAKKDMVNSKTKQRRKFTNNSFNRLNPIDSSAQQLDDAQHINIYSSVSKDYLDHGDQDFICELCYAKLWQSEAARGKSNIYNHTSYFVCCGYGKVQLPDIKEPPQAYKSLYDGLDPKSKFFLKNIRRYNSMFSFTSTGRKIDSSINRGNAPYVFKLSGQNYHSIGSLLPTDGSKAKFSQLYIYDTDNEVSNRQSIFVDTNKASTSTSQDIDFEIIQHLKNILDSNNVLVQSYRMVRDCFKEKPNLDLKLRLIGNRQKDGRTYNLPTASEVAALIVGDIGDSLENRDIVVLTKEGYLKHISELHPSYLALQYPLLFLYGEDFYRVDIPHRSVDSSTSSKNKKCTMREFFAYRIQDRIAVFSTILNSRRLYQQFLVDGYTMIEAERLNYIRNQQKELRCESFEKLRNLRNRGTTDVSKVGKRVILPSSFTGGARYMTQNYLDAMSICKWYGYPNLFLTFTCNPKWPEVKRFLKDTDLNAEDMPDILCRLFKIKLDSLIKDLKEKSLLGKVLAGPDRVTVSVVEGDQEDVQEPAVDEIKNYYDCRYVSACEASWRIFSYDVYYRYPSVIRLPFHLPNQQQVIYGPNEYIDNVLNKPSVSSTMFLSWMEYNECNEDARNITYVEFPTKYVWKSEQQCWARRKQGFSLGRIHAISPSAGEGYFLRILLNKVKGPKSFDDILTVNGHKYNTFRQACYAAGLLDDDTKYVEGIQEVSHADSDHYLRCLFATMLTSNSLSRPDYVWDKTWEILSDVILYKQRRILKSPDLFLNEDQIKNLTLNEIEKILVRNNHNLRDYKTMPYPDYDSISSSNNRLITEEMDYDRHLQIEFDNLFIALTAEKKSVYTEIINAVRDNQGGVFLFTVMAEPEKTSLIIWDEAPMIHRHGFEALDRTLRDILSHDDSNNSSMPFGGKTIVFGGDFRQVLPVIQSGTRQDIVNASLSSSYIWDYCKVLRLTKNMRLTVGSEAHNTEETKIFAPWFFPGKSHSCTNENEVVDEINDRLLSMFPGDSKEYLSSDSICPDENINDAIDPSLYSPDVLNGLKIPGLPHHKLAIKVGVPVMLLRNINQKEGFCNGTRLKVVSLGKHVIEVEVIAGSNLGTRTLIHRIALTPSDKRIPFKFQRRQFPIAVCFAMTINKSQGQSLSRVGLFFKQPVFSHGQLYVALSRVKSRDGIKLVIFDKDGNLTNRTSNVVYKEVFRDL
ncbi:uncharacterized protein LOC143618348 [Bidens hawaiensis]|uniref:uncharacterized protein LOC143618348 n=1 Tax=Bidens hawaiensis TaxID=980011 RepID=UPI004049AA53